MALNFVVYSQFEFVCDSGKFCLPRYGLYWLSDSGEFEREKQLRISVLRKRIKTTFNTYAFRNGDESWKHYRVPLPFECLMRITHARSHVFVETHPECREF